MQSKIKLVLIIIFFFFTIPVFSQEVDIVPFLKEIESGDKASAQDHLAQLLEKSPGDPSVKFLKGVLTENGQDAVEIYTDIVKNHPRSKYADASLYRLYSYYYALGMYETSKGYLTRLKKDYPLSPYIKTAEREIPSFDEPVITNAGKTGETGVPKISRYTIQAGAFSNITNARSLISDFKKSGFQTEIGEKTVAGTVFHIVYVGKFETEEEARSFLQVINNEYKLEGRVINLN
ncbi:MAG: SPOR domain-containing protein [Ignavibacteriaceae bacterium]